MAKDRRPSLLQRGHVDVGTDAPLTPEDSCPYIQGNLEFRTVITKAEDQKDLPRRLNINDKLRVSVGESCKLVLVQVHDEEFVGGREFHRLPRELLIKVGSVVLVFLLDEKHRVKKGGRGNGAGGAGQRTCPPQQTSCQTHQAAQKRRGKE